LRRVHLVKTTEEDSLILLQRAKLFLEEGGRRGP
jgi:hypothetical protein